MGYISGCRTIGVFRIVTDNVGKQNFYQFIFNCRINLLLQIYINGQVNIMSRSCIGFVNDFCNTPDGINIDFFRTLLSRKFGFEGLFNAGLTNNVIGFVRIIFCL